MRIWKGSGASFVNTRSGFKRGLIIGVVVSVLVNGIVFLKWASSSFSWGQPLDGWDNLALLLAAVALMAAAVGGFLSLFPRTRAVGVFLAPASIIFVVSFVAASYAGSAVRMLGFERFAERAQPVVDAIESYARQNGQPPASLAELFPDYLASVPSTGVGSAPEFRYISGEQAKRDYDGNPWVLQLDVSTGALNWDILVYYPLQNYPEHGHGGRLERIGGWAYVHE